jgi:tetratricopeptide (TPR) repeat protein
MAGASPSYSQSSAVESYNRGVEYGIQGKFAEAKDTFEKAMQADPAFALVRENLITIRDVTSKKISKVTAIHLFKGIGNSDKKMFDAALGEVNKALEIDQTYAGTYNIRGNVHKKRRDYISAISDFTKAIAMDPNCDSAYNNRGNMYMVQEDFDPAISDLTKAIHLNPSDPLHYYDRANVYDDLKEYDRAISDLSKAIEINPSFGRAYDNKGFIYMVGLADREKACSNWKQACELGYCYNYGRSRDNGHCK